MAINYGFEKYSNAFRALQAKGGWQSRLQKALTLIVPVSPKDIPPALQERHAAIKAAGGEGQIQATMSQMNETEGLRLIDQIEAMYSDLKAAAKHPPQ